MNRDKFRNMQDYVSQKLIVNNSVHLSDNKHRNTYYSTDNQPFNNTEVYILNNAQDEGVLNLEYA
jgi:hypothetical protein